MRDKQTEKEIKENREEQRIIYRQTEKETNKTQIEGGKR